MPKPAPAPHSLAAALFRAVPSAVLLTDAAGRLTALNPTAEKLLARPPAEAHRTAGLPLSALNADLAQRLAQARRAPTPQPSAFEIEWRERHFAVTLTPLPDTAPPLTGWLFVLEDISHVRQAERWRNETVQAAAHDLRNPLNLIAGSINLLADSLPIPSADQAEYLTMLRAGVERMSAMIDQLLALEQAQGGVGHRLLSLREVIQRATHEFQHEAAAKPLHLTFEGAPSDSLIAGDEVWLQRAIANLLGNALKYTPAGGRITVRYLEAEGRAIVEVTDTGLGVPLEAQPHLFERFYRVKNAATRHIPGSGLGLAIVKAIVTEHGGQVWVSSAEGQGSTFGFSIPLAQPTGPL